MFVSAIDLRKGMVLDIGGKRYQVMEAEPVKPGKGPAIVRARLYDLSTEMIEEKIFRPTDGLERIVE